MKNIYIYPSNSPGKNSGVPVNPYMNNLFKSMSLCFNVINLNKVTKVGQLLDVYCFLNKKIDYIYFNWIESAPNGRFGFLQYWLYYVLLFVLKIKRVEIIYLKHNKISHAGNKLSNKLIDRTIKAADYVIVHGVDESIRIKEKNIKSKVNYICHPFEGVKSIVCVDKVYDILIWGTIEPYKGVLEFLRYLDQSGLRNAYRILIIGKIPDLSYAEKINRFNSDNITIKNRPVDDSELSGLINMSWIVLFPYKAEYVISSGSVIDALSYRANVLGPRCGVFKDMSEVGLATTYVDYKDMVEKVNYILKNKVKINENILQNIVNDNLWRDYGYKVCQIIS